MAKRYTDDSKWRDDWWGSLSNDYRIVWLYLCDSCSHAGIWKKDIRGLNFNCNTKITYEELESITGGRLIDCGSFYWIPKFVKFQNKHGLGSKKPMVVGIRQEIREKIDHLIVKQQLPNDYPIIYEGAHGKGVGMEQEREREEVTISDDSPIVNQLLLNNYEEWRARICHSRGVDEKWFDDMAEAFRLNCIEISKIHKDENARRAGLEKWINGCIRNEKTRGNGVTTIKGEDRNPANRKSRPNQILTDGEEKLIDAILDGKIQTQ